MLDLEDGWYHHAHYRCCHLFYFVKNKEVIAFYNRGEPGYISKLESVNKYPLLPDTPDIEECNTWEITNYAQSWHGRLSLGGEHFQPYRPDWAGREGVPFYMRSIHFTSDHLVNGKFSPVTLTDGPPPKKFIPIPLLQLD